MTRLLTIIQLLLFAPVATDAAYEIRSLAQERTLNLLNDNSFFATNELSGEEFVDICTSYLAECRVRMSQADPTVIGLVLELVDDETGDLAVTVNDFYAAWSDGKASLTDIGSVVAVLLTELEMGQILGVLTGGTGDESVDNASPTEVLTVLLGGLLGRESAPMSSLIDYFLELVFADNAQKLAEAENDTDATNATDTTNTTTNEPTPPEETLREDVIETLLDSIDLAEQELGTTVTQMVNLFVDDGGTADAIIAVVRVFVDMLSILIPAPRSSGPRRRALLEQVVMGGGGGERHRHRAVQKDEKSQREDDEDDEYYDDDSESNDDGYYSKGLKESKMRAQYPNSVSAPELEDGDDGAEDTSSADPIVTIQPLVVADPDDTSVPDVAAASLEDSSIPTASPADDPSVQFETETTLVVIPEPVDVAGGSSGATSVEEISSGVVPSSAPVVTQIDAEGPGDFLDTPSGPRTQAPSWFINPIIIVDGEEVATSGGVDNDADTATDEVATSNSTITITTSDETAETTTTARAGPEDNNNGDDEDQGSDGLAGTTIGNGAAATAVWSVGDSCGVPGDDCPALRCACQQCDNGVDLFGCCGTCVVIETTNRTKVCSGFIPESFCPGQDGEAAASDEETDEVFFSATSASGGELNQTVTADDHKTARSSITAPFSRLNEILATIRPRETIQIPHMGSFIEISSLDENLLLLQTEVGMFFETLRAAAVAERDVGLFADHDGTTLADDHKNGTKSPPQQQQQVVEADVLDQFVNLLNLDLIVTTVGGLNSLLGTLGGQTDPQDPFAYLASFIALAGEVLGQGEESNVYFSLGGLLQLIASLTVFQGTYRYMEATFPKSFPNAIRPDLQVAAEMIDVELSEVLTVLQTMAADNSTNSTTLELYNATVVNEMTCRLELLACETSETVLQQ
jgi:hypothetical protein